MIMLLLGNCTMKNFAFPSREYFSIILSVASFICIHVYTLQHALLVTLFFFQVSILIKVGNWKLRNVYTSKCGMRLQKEHRRCQR